MRQATRHHLVELTISDPIDITMLPTPQKDICVSIGDSCGRFDAECTECPIRFRIISDMGCPLRLLMSVSNGGVIHHP